MKKILCILSIIFASGCSAFKEQGERNLVPQLEKEYANIQTINTVYMENYVNPNKILFASEEEVQMSLVQQKTEKLLVERVKAYNQLAEKLGEEFFEQVDEMLPRKMEVKNGRVYYQYKK